MMRFGERVLNTEMRFEDNIIPIGRRHLLVWQGVVSAVVFLAIGIFLPVLPLAQDASADNARIEYLYDAFGAAGRRANPSAAQIEWRREAGQYDVDHWPSELELREIEPVLMQFFGSLHGRAFDRAQLVGLLSDDFVGTGIRAAGEPRTEAGELTLVRWTLDERPTLDREAFAANWEQRLQAFRHVIRTEHFVDHFERLEAPGVRRLDIPFRVTGFRDARGCEDQGRMVLDLAKGDDGHWRIRRADLRMLETLESSALFETEPLLPTAPAPDIPITAFVEYFAQGVSAVDLDDDGDIDIVAAERVGAPRVLQNDGNGRFTDITKDTAFAAINAARSIYFFDWDNDGDRDALVLTAQRMHLLEARDGKFVDVSDASRFDRLTTTGLTSATVADYDNDGRLDFYVANYGDLARSPVLDYFDSKRGYNNQLFRNMGDGRFAMYTREAGLDLDNLRWSFAAVSLDFDRDGDQDIYVVNDYGPNQLFRNDGEWRFTDIAASVGATDFGNGMGASVGDLDGDGWEDLYVSNMISHAGQRIAASEDFPDDAEARDRLRRFAKGNTLLLGGPSGVYQERESGTHQIGDAKWAWGNVLFDYDNDGDLDVYVTNGMFSNLRRSDTDPVFWRHLLAPVSTGTLPAAFATGYFAYLMQQESFSFAGFERNRLFQNFGGGEFRDVAQPTGTDLVLDSRSVVAADLDADGRLDLVVANRNEPRLVVHWNRVPAPGRHLEVRLEGQRSNRDGIGAVVTVRCDGESQRRTHLGASGYLSQGPRNEWFGLGDCDGPAEVAVQWPSGAATSPVSVAGSASQVTVSEE